MFTDFFDYLYVEPSSFCNLKCPRCPRTYDKQSYAPTNLNIDLFSQILESKLWSDLKILEYGGNLGDPLMHPLLPQMINLARKIIPDLCQMIHTSGNHGDSVWRRNLEALTAKDIVLFSVDGLKDSNHIYRIGAKWERIEEAMNLCAGKVRLFWKFIVFKHNQKQVVEAAKIAKAKGFEQFIVTKSHLFYGEWSEADGSDSMAPKAEWVSQRAAGPTIFSPKCQSASMHYISADGKYMPCCWSQNYKEIHFPVEQTEASNDTLHRILKSEQLNSLKSRWQDDPHFFCHKKCRSHIGNRSSHNQLKLNLLQPIDLIEDKIHQFGSVFI